MTPIILHPAQSKIASDLTRFRVINCGRRFGKTILSVLEMIGKAVYKRERNICYVAPIFQQARDIAWQELKKQVQPIIQDANESRLELTVKTVDGGLSKIFLRSWDAIETLRGMRFDMLVLDEVASYRNFWVGWNEVLRPTLTDTKGDAMFISTPKGFNHFFDLYNLEQTSKDYKSFHFTSYDNPFLDSKELDTAKNELTEDQFAQEYLADFRKQKGLVYKEFSRDKHLFANDDLVINPIEKIAGIDFGFVNPCAVLTIKKDYDNKFWVLDELYKRGQSDVMVAEYVASQGFNKVYPDPESPSAIDELRKRGVNVREVIKNKDSIKNGIEQVRELFKADRLFIHARCQNLVSELETYCYPEKRDLHNEYENPVPENDHAASALRYALSSQEDIQKIRSEAKIFYPSNIK